MYILNSTQGWCTLKLGENSYTVSHKSDIAFDMLGSFIAYYEKGAVPVFEFESEEHTYLIAVNEHEVDIIDKGDMVHPDVYIVERDEFIAEMLDDITHHADKMAEWGYKLDEYEIRQRLRQIFFECDRLRKLIHKKDKDEIIKLKEAIRNNNLVMCI